jgi:type I restriction-modification system DNA methylase subunit
MISLIEKYQNNYRTNGWFILKLPEFEQKIKNIKKIFLKTYYSKFTTDVESNRELIKRFVDHPDVLNAIYSHDLISTLKETMNINNLIKCGPCITHYTSNDTTGNSFGVDYHQDYPSMA